MHVISLYICRWVLINFARLNLGGTSTLHRYLLLSIWLKKYCLTLTLVKVFFSLFTKLCFSNRITIIEVFEFKLYCKGHTKSFAYFEHVKHVVFMKRIETSMYNPSMILVLNNVLNGDNVKFRSVGICLCSKTNLTLV